MKTGSAKSTKQDFAFYLGAKGADAYFLTVSKDTTNLIATSKKIHKSMNKLKVNNKSTKKILGNLKKELSKSKIDKATWKKVLADITILKDEITANLNSKYKDGDKSILYNVGGWLEGYRLSASAIKDNYSKKETSILTQKILVSYLLKKLQGSSKAKKFTGYKDIENALKEINNTLSKSKNRELSKKNVDSLVTTLSKIKKYM
jgi:CRISPR/Cas system CSM-associated protein Csm2 small subunit